MLTGRTTPASSPDGPAREVFNWGDDWELLYSDAPIAMGLLDTTFRYVHVNKRLAWINRQPPQFHIGRLVDEISPASAKLMPSLRTLLDGTQPEVTLVVEGSDGDGVAGGNVLRFNLRAVRDAGGTPRFLSVIAYVEPSANAETAEQKRQNDFARLLSRLSSEFATVPADAVDARIEAGMAKLVHYMGAQRSTLAEVDADANLRITHCHAEPGFKALPPGLVKDGLPWYASTLQSGQTIRLSSPDDLPPEAIHERRMSEYDGFKATIIIPFSVGGSPLCALSLGWASTRQSTDEDVARLKVAGEVLANALARKRYDENLQRTRENLAHMSRVSTVGQLATSITHEINQPLCAMVSNAEAALRFVTVEEPDLPQAVAALSDIVADGKRAGEVIARTYAMLKRHTVKFELHEINRLIEGIRPVVANYAMIRRLSLEMALDPRVPKVQGHAVQLQQVIINLLVNGIDAVAIDSTTNGLVTIKTAHDQQKQEVVVTVTDNGIGLPPAAFDLVFEPFYTSKSNGLGMGLSIARTIVESHGGRLWAQNNVDRGASFSFSLPVPKEIAS